MNNQPKTETCPSCKQTISANITKCPYCGKHLKNWFKRHPILTAILALFIIPPFLGNMFSSSKSSSTVNNPVETPSQKQIISPKPINQIEPIFNVNKITNKNIVEIKQVLGEPTSNINPSGDMYGEILWVKDGISLAIPYLNKNSIPQAFDFQFDKATLSFSDADFKKAFALIGKQLQKSYFSNTSSPTFTRFTAKDLTNFEQINVQSTVEDKKNINFIRSCEPEPFLCD